MLFRSVRAICRRGWAIQPAIQSVEHVIAAHGKQILKLVSIQAINLLADAPVVDALIDEVAQREGYDVLATGHNLDDEAAVLFGNTLRWDVEYLRRQAPVLAAGNGFGKKVKPLVRLTEREMAAWCVVRGIDYVVEECPMAVGNKHLAYKDALNSLDATSPGTKEIGRAHV